MLSAKKLGVMLLEVLILQALLVSIGVMLLTVTYIVALRTHYLYTLEGEQWWGTIIQGVCIMLALGYMTYKLTKTSLRLIRNYVFLCRNRHNKSYWLYEGVFHR